MARGGRGWGGFVRAERGVEVFVGGEVAAGGRVGEGGCVGGCA